MRTNNIASANMLVTSAILRRTKVQAVRMKPTVRNGVSIQQQDTGLKLIHYFPSGDDTCVVKFLEYSRMCKDLDEE